MKPIWRVFYLLIVLTLLLPLASWSAGEQEAAKEEGPATVKWFMRWDNERVDRVAKPVMGAFMKANPNITLEFENIGTGSDYYTKLNTLAAAGDMPDVTYLAPHYVAIYGSKRAIVPLDDMMKKHGVDPGVYYQKVLNFYKRDGRTYGLPIDAAALVVFFNKDMFDSTGVPYPKEGWTWKDLVSLGKKFVKDLDGDGKIDQSAIHLSPDYWPVYLFAQTGHTVFDDYFKPTKYLMTQPDSVQAFQEYSDMWLVHSIAPHPSQIQQIKDYFMAGKAAMILIGSWNMPKYIASIKAFSWDLAPLPLGTTAKAYNRGDGSSFCLSSDSKFPEAAFKFIKYLAGPGSEGVNILLDRQQMLPAIKSMAESDRFLKPDPSLTGGLTLNKAAYFFGNENQFSMYDPIHAVYEKVNAVHKAELNEAQYGKVSAALAIERAAGQIADILKEAK
jgi:multiple sugar transport system substrate-binding protein